jgi:energy-coupling factor transporter ATP-binding protein EcfA2
MTTSPAIRVAGLTKSYGDHSVLRGVDFDVAAGSILALLGSNGAGKTTVVRILSTLSKADRGTAVVCGHDVAASVSCWPPARGEFAAAVADIDCRLRAEIRQRQSHRERVAQLASGDSLALPPEAVAYLDRMRELGFRERVVEIERDSWILVAAHAPNQVPAMMTLKRHQIEDPVVRELYLAIDGIFGCRPDDPRLRALADRVVAFIEAAGRTGRRTSAGRRPVAHRRRHRPPRLCRRRLLRGRPPPPATARGTRLHRLDQHPTERRPSPHLLPPTSSTSARTRVELIGDGVEVGFGVD